MPRQSAQHVTRSKPDGWLGEQLSVGFNGERFYGGVRLAGYVYHKGDAVMIHCEDHDKAQVMRLDHLWEDDQKRKYFSGHWYYRPEETNCGRLHGHDKREVFETSHEMEEQLETINGVCTVMSWADYERWLDSPADSKRDGSSR